MNYDKSMFAYTVTPQTITIVFNNKTNSIHSSSANYQPLLEAIKTDDWEAVVRNLTPENVLRQQSGNRMRVSNGQVYVQVDRVTEWPVPTDLNDHILFYMKEGLDFNPLINFALKLRENPSYRAVQCLFNWLQGSKLVVTADGDFLGYKNVRKDFKDWHTGNFDNSVGRVLKMPRNEVCEDSSQGCSNGFHIGNYEGAQGFRNDGVLTLNKVNPANVVSVPDHEIWKMRVCEYEVIGLVDSEISTPQYPSHELCGD